MSGRQQAMGAPGRGAPASSECLEGRVEFVIFRAPDGPFTVVKVRPLAGGSAVCAAGPVLDLPAAGSPAVWRFRGAWAVHPRFGRQFRFEACELVPPSTREGVRAFLSSRFIRGIGPSLAARIVERFGASALEVIRYGPERLLEVPGIGEARVRMIRESIEERLFLQEVLVWLMGHGVTPGLAHRVVRHFGAPGRDGRPPSAREVRARIEADPYGVTETPGVGFLLADRIGRSLGIAPGDPRRVRAAVLHALDTAASRAGDVFLPLEEIRRTLEGDYGVSPAAGLEEAVAGLAAEGKVVREPGSGVYPADLHRAEASSALEITRLIRPMAPPLFPAALQAGFRPDAGQLRAVETALGQGLSVITGGPGSGKTTVLELVARSLGADGVLLCAPTGRAAKRVTEKTGLAAMTIHRALRYRPAGDGRMEYAHNRSNPLPCRTVIVDEASMVDVRLLARLLEALRDDARLVLAGDADQLPSVGPGACLDDIIESGRAPVTRLEGNHRQGPGSGIPALARMILRGVIPRDGDFRDGCAFVEEEDAERAAQRAVEIAAEAAARGGEVQALAPMRRGPCGTERLNALLRERLNPSGAPIPGTPFRAGDRVMQVRNDYRRPACSGGLAGIRDCRRERLCEDCPSAEFGVFNGETGRAAFVGGFAAVEFDADRAGLYRPEEAAESLAPAFAMTIHKSQGSEYGHVVLVCHRSHYIMLARRLLYTAVTRAVDRLTIVGDRKALAVAVRNEAFRRRRTSLARRLCDIARRVYGEEPARQAHLFPAENTTFRQDAPDRA